MLHAIRRLIAFVLLIALVCPAVPALARAKPNAALGKQMQQVANRFISAIRRTKPLKGFMSKRVEVSYSYIARQ